MKTILCYGDSLTFGADPESEGRHAFEDRWPSVLEAGLGGAARVIAEGLGGRTTAFDDDTIAADLNGVRILPVMLKSHEPLDAVVIMLGTNDLKIYTGGGALGAAMGMKRLVRLIQTFPYDHQDAPPRVVVVAPPLPVATDHADLGPMFEGAPEEARKLAGHYARVAEELGAAFFDAATVAAAAPLDGVHLNAANTRAIGEALVPVVKGVLGP
jgi:lysophospholipase L1-like esterase